MHCGLKKKRKDLSLFYSEKKCRVAAFFTTNVVKAAPVLLAQETLKKTDCLRAVLVNSGNANCMTGKRGMEDAEKMAAMASEALGIPVEEIVVSSTGVIGKPLDTEPIRKGLPGLVSGLSEEGLMDAAEGIMTTDRFHKISSGAFNVGAKTVHMVGVAKGAGMIHPNMATMLCYIMTDAAISKKALNRAMKEANNISFNSISVDGDMSTNDTVLILANGAAANAEITGGKAYKDFANALGGITTDLAKMIVRDGEGAKKLIAIKVKGARSKPEAKKAADSVGNSLLTKCAVHGGDPNWGRVAASVGYSGIKFDPDKLEIALDGVLFFRKGKFQAPSKKKLAHVFKSDEVKIEINLHRGDKEAVVYTCDISKKYIAINSYYTT
jgi:glutamate N-acetyltransferase/amino-acid N-acetyltransferase